LFNSKKVPSLKWWKATPNWGDTFSPVLFERISGVRPRHLGRENPRRLPNYVSMGSILSWADEQSAVWGAGFLSEGQELEGRPQQVCAVRGPLSRKILFTQHVPCPEVYGDPALLLPRFFSPALTGEFRLGVVAHYVDKGDRRLRRLRSDGDVLLIDVQGGVDDFVRQVCRCRAIVSSSLHGMIVADAYGIPAGWVELSERVVGNGFKFRDYFASVGKTTTKPMRIDEEVSAAMLLDAVDTAGASIDLDALWDTCPFKDLGERNGASGRGTRNT